MFDKSWMEMNAMDLPPGDSSREDHDGETGNGDGALYDPAAFEPAPPDSAPLDSAPLDSAPPAPGSAEGDGLPQGMWLTATAWLPPGLLSSVAGGGADPARPAGFCQGSVLDELPPGPTLTTFTAEAVGGVVGTGFSAPDAKRDSEYQAPRLAQLSDEELTGIIRSYRKQASWAQAGELAAVAELAARRRAGALADGVRDSLAADAATDEIAAALTLTGRAAQLLTDRATTLKELPGTFMALATGRIDMPRALILLTGLAGQEPDLVRAVEAQVIDRAATQTTGQLRASLNRALLAADPAAADRRRQAEEMYARIEQIPEPGGVTAALNGRYLPVTAAIAAWNRVSDLARQLKTSGAEGNLDQLRVQVYLALLNGQAVGAPSGGEPAEGNAAREQGRQRDGGAPDGPAPGGPAANGPVPDGPAASGPAPVNPAGPAHLTGTVNVTVPLATLLGITEAPGELGAFGPITAHTAREITSAALESPLIRWCVTITDDNSVPVGHGCASRHRKRKANTQKPEEWAFTVELRALAAADCRHERESSNYRPPPSLWHLIQIRNQRCTFAGCRMPAAKCDDDHTIPFGKGGRTCECNLGPLCRHHHRMKQLQGWRLEQPEPGVLAWVTPSGWKYCTGPAMYAA